MRRLRFCAVRHGCARGRGPCRGAARVTARRGRVRRARAGLGNAMAWRAQAAHVGSLRARAGRAWHAAPVGDGGGDASRSASATAAARRAAARRGRPALSRAVTLPRPAPSPSAPACASRRAVAAAAAWRARSTARVPRQYGKRAARTRASSGLGRRRHGSHRACPMRHAQRAAAPPGRAPVLPAAAPAPPRPLWARRGAGGGQRRRPLPDGSSGPPRSRCCRARRPGRRPRAISTVPLRRRALAAPGRR